MKRFLRSTNSRLLEALQRVVPKRAHAVVYGYPTEEGNAVEVVRGLSRRYRGRVYWFVDGDRAGQAEAMPGNVRVVTKTSPAALARYVSAEIVFFTHGLYGDARPSARQTFVNLWHGDGVKVEAAAESARRPKHPSHYVVGGTRVLTAQKAATFRVPAGGELVLGNPRVDQFSRGVPEGFWHAVGIDPARPFVVWLPTFRAARAHGVAAGWFDVRDDERQVNLAMAEVVQGLRDAGVQVLAKPHPLDAQSRDVPGTCHVDNASLLRQGTTLYAVLGQSAGLVTDYSSAWTDYLLLDRPIGFVMPDAEAYAAGRGLYPADVLDWLPGRTLGAEADVRAFATEVHGRGETTAALRRRAAARLGLVRCTTATDDLLDELERQRAFPVSRTLKPRASAASPVAPREGNGEPAGDHGGQVLQATERQHG